MSDQKPAVYDFAAINKAMNQQAITVPDSHDWQDKFADMNALDNEGDLCPRCREGRLIAIHDGGCCSCHLHPLCGYCMSARLRCVECDLEGGIAC